MTTAIVITTIGINNSVQYYDNLITEYGLQDRYRLYIIGDTKTPDLSVVNGDYYSIERQEHIFGKLPFYSTLPYNCYTRKNLGYILAQRDNCQAVYSTDDDNYCISVHDLIVQTDFSIRPRCLLANTPSGYANYLHYFNSDLNHHLWPRGIPPADSHNCTVVYRHENNDRVGVIAGICDKSPDFDAIGHVLYPHDVIFQRREPLYHHVGFAPYNTQNTTIAQRWLPYHLLPSHTGRACDIWASYLGQRVMQASGYGVAFMYPTVVQKRNPHTAEADICDEKDVIIQSNRFINLLLEVDAHENESPATFYWRLCQSVSKIMPSGFMPQVELWLEAFKA